MWTKEELKNLFEDRLRQWEEETADYQKQLKEVQGKLDGVSNERYWQEYKETGNKLREALTDEGKELVKKRELLRKKKEKAKLLGFAFMGSYLILAAVILFVLKPDFSIPNIAVYAIAVALAIVAYIIPVTVRKVKLNGAIKVISGDPQIAEYDKNDFEAFKIYDKNVKDNQETVNKYKLEEKNIRASIQKLENKKKECLHQLDELDFNCAYAGNILFYGKEKRNHYDIYIDGRHYDTVRGHQIIQIKLTPGLHSVKFENTSYNLADRSDVVYSYSFNTEQIEVGDVPEAYAFVCEFKTLTRVSGENFQNITKTKMV